MIKRFLWKVTAILPDDIFIKIQYFRFLRKFPDLKNPRTFNEKLQWLKLHDRNPFYTVLVDKYKVREYIAKKIGSQYLIPLLGVWDDPDKIDFDKLPNKFVLKCNHNSGLGMCICKDKTMLNINKVKEDLSKGLRQNYYLTGREWPYKNVNPCIIAEKYIENTDLKELVDYKFYCFNGYVDSVMVCIGRSTGDPRFYFFDKNWNLKRYNLCGKVAPRDFSLERPANMDKMFGIAEVLSKEIEAPFVRVDLYNVDGKIYFGEFTFYPDSGFDGNRLSETDVYFGNLVKLKYKE